ncbi:MAG TPA: type II toxin-antitoxin system RelE/ParE family toxin [Bacteroidales bacterium]|jgi:mRNA interferase RelE/StbE|nr:type II toxin-antitoxin system RelE/ParE family toxin [Bacteroidales bacterium]
MKTVFKNTFLKSIQKIRSEQIKSEISRSIENVESSNTLRAINNLKKLKGYKNFYRIRIGTYRIGLKIEGNTVYFVDIDNRKDIYKRFP